MNKRAIKYQHIHKEIWLEIHLDPNSKAYELYKEKKTDELNKHLDLCLLAETKWKR